MSLSLSEYKTAINTKDDSIIFDESYVQEIQNLMTKIGMKDVLDLVKNIPWRYDEKDNKVGDDTEKDMHKFGPEMKQVDQSIESYKWVIPVGNVRSIISQLQSLNDSMKSESDLNSTETLRLKSDLIIYFCKEYLDELNSLAQETPKLFYDDDYDFQDTSDTTSQSISPTLETIISAFSGFSLHILSIASQGNTSLFNEMYPQLCNVLCNIPAFSLQDQPSIIHKTYGEIQVFLGDLLKSNGDYSTSALKSLIQVALARGTTDSILTTVYCLTQVSASLSIDLSSIVSCLKDHLIDIGYQHHFHCYGSNEHYQLGTEGDVTENLVSEKMKNHIVMVQVGKDATYMVDSNNTLIGSGNALKGQMGMVEKQKHVALNPISFTFPAKIRALGNVANSQSMFVILEDDRVYSFGNGQSNVLGYKSVGEFSHTPKQIVLPSGCKPLNIAASQSHCVMVDSLGYVFTWGDNTKKQCGFDDQTTVVHAPAVHPTLNHIIQVAAGTSHSVFLDSNGYVYVCGSNEDGQLGDSNINGTTTVVQLQLPFLVSRIAAGSTCTLLLGRDGNVYFSGTLLQQLSLTPFTCVLDYSKGKVRDIYAAGDVCAVLYEDDSMYVWGDNSTQLFGSLPIFMEEPTLFPNTIHDIESISLSPTHMVVVSSSAWKNDLSFTLSPLLPSEIALLKDWYPKKLIDYHETTATRLNQLDAISLLLSYLALSNNTLLSEQAARSKKKAKSCKGSFIPHTTEQSIQENIQVIAFLRDEYTKTYRHEGDMNRSGLSTSSLQSSMMMSSTIPEEEHSFVPQKQDPSLVLHPPPAPSSILPSTPAQAQAPSVQTQAPPSILPSTQTQVPTHIQLPPRSQVSPLTRSVVPPPPPPTPAPVPLSPRSVVRPVPLPPPAPVTVDNSSVTSTTTPASSPKNDNEETTSEPDDKSFSAYFRSDDEDATIKPKLSDSTSTNKTHSTGTSSGYSSGYSYYDDDSSSFHSISDSSSVMSRDESSSVTSSTVSQASQASQASTTNRPVIPLPTRSLNTSMRSTNDSTKPITLPRPPSVRVIKPPKQRVVEEPSLGAELMDMSMDDLDFGELLTMNYSESQSISHISQTYRRSYALNGTNENKQVCYLLYRSIQLLRSQLTILAHTVHDSVNVFSSYSSIMSTLISVLVLDSNSTEMSIIKKETVECLSLLPIFCHSIQEMKILIEFLFTVYEKAKQDKQTDSFAILDIVFGMFEKISEFHLLEYFLHSDNRIAILKILQEIFVIVFANMDNEYGDYSKRLSSEKRTISFSGITDCIIYSIRVLFGLYNDEYTAVYAGSIEKLESLNVLMETLVDLCIMILNSSTTILDRCVETILYENSISEQVGYFLETSLVYKGVEYALLVLYSVMSRKYEANESMFEKGFDLDKYYRNTINRIRVVLRPVSTMVVTLDRCIEYIDNRTDKVSERTNVWMLDCSSIFTSFSSFVTSVLIKQKPVEVEMTEANKENAAWLNSPLLSQGLCSDSEDPIRKQCLALLNGDDQEWYDQITALKKVNKLNQRFLKAHSVVPCIIRYITASYIWLSPSCYYSLYQGDKLSSSISQAYSLALQFLQHISQLHQNNEEYEDIDKAFKNQCSFLLNVQPLVTIHDVNDYDRVIADTYQYLKNEKVIEEDEDEDEEEDEDDIKENVNDAILDLAKKFITGKPDVADLYTSIQARSTVAENRAVAFEYFSSLLQKVTSAHIRYYLMESIAHILEYRDESDGSLRKTHFMFNLEGSSPVYLKRVSSAFASIIESSLMKIDSHNTTTSDKTMILYSLAIPYSPNDAPLLQQSNLLLPLSHLWSFKKEFIQSKYMFKPSSVVLPTIFTTGNQMNEQPGSVDHKWKSILLTEGMKEVVTTASSVYALRQDGVVMQYMEGKQPKQLTVPSITSLAASPYGNHVLFLTNTGNVFSTGANNSSQCGRKDFNNGWCEDVKPVFGACSSKTITKIACGKDHSIFLSNDNCVFGCGLNSSFQLGSSTGVAEVTKEITPLHNKKIKYIACGDSFSLFATDTQLFVVGKNDCGQLGFNPAETPIIKEPTEISLPTAIQSQRIAGIFAGSHHIGILTQKNTVFLMGDNSKGQLGSGTFIASYQFVELLNMTVSKLYLTGNSTILISEDVVYCMGDNTANIFGITSAPSYRYPQPVMDCSGYTVLSLSGNASSTMVVLSPDASLKKPKPFSEKSLKVAYASWLLANLLFASSCQDQLELSVFSLQFLHIFLREISQISNFIGSQYFWDEWDEYSPRSLREGSVGMIRHVLATIENSSYKTEPTPFTYLNQILSTLVVSARKSDGLVKALAEESSLNVLMALFIQILKLHETMSTSSSCQYLYLDNQPYITPILLCFQYLVSLLILVLPHTTPSTVNSVLLSTVPSTTLSELTAGLPRKKEDSLLPTILLHTMGRIIEIPYGPGKSMIPAPYYSRLISSKCTELMWSLLPIKSWNTVINNCVSVCCGMCITTDTILQRLIQQPIDYSACDELYLIAGAMAFYAGFSSVPMIDSQIAVTVGTLRQDGHILMFRDRLRKYHWEGACVIKLSGSKELAWVRDVRELTLVTNRIPIDSYLMLSRVFDNFEYILKLRSTNRHVRNSALLSQLQQAAIYSIMKLLQFPQAAPFISLSSIRSVVNFLHLQVPVQYASAAVDVLKERQELLEGFWKLHTWESIQSSLVATTTIDYNINSWPPSIPTGMKRCNVCKFCYPASSTTCNLCGSMYNVTLSDLVEQAKNIDQARMSQASLSNIAEEDDDELEEIGIVRKWMFLESIVDPPDAKCTVRGLTNWREIKLAKTQKQVLLLNESSSIALRHPFISTKDGVYLNVWTLVLDIVASDFPSRDYTCLLQTDPTNKLPGSFYIRRDGSCGIGVYSQPGVIKQNCFHRIIISADLPHHKIVWYVDGKRQGELSPATMPNAKIVPDDRWSLDDTFLIGTDCESCYIGSLFISSVQLRRKLIYDEEAKQIGGVSFDGPPEPSNEDVIRQLINELHVPRSWCVIALENVASQNERRARKWIQENASNINRILLTEARGLEKLGYDKKRSKRLILTYGSREKALEFLECNIADEASKSTPELEHFVEELEGLERMEQLENRLTHPGTFDESWSCCGSMDRSAPGCTNGEGRTVGVIAIGDRVTHGPHWKWGSQGNFTCGTVQNITNWDVHLSKGALVKWDDGTEGLYRWNVNGCFDLAVICEASKTAKEFTISSVYGNDSATDNPAYEVVNDIKTRFKNSQVKRKTRFPDVRDASLPEISEELCTASRALCSSYARVALLNLLSLSNNDDKTNNQISIYSLFMNKQDNLFRSFLSAFIHVDGNNLTDNDPLNELQKEITNVLKKDITASKELMEKKDDSKSPQLRLLYFWIQSFSRRILSTLLLEVSLLIQPVLPEACQSLPLLPCTKYSLIARYPERQISFWLPECAKGIPFATVIKTGEGSTLGIPPTTTTYVLNTSQSSVNDSHYFARPIRYDLVNTFTTTTGDIFSIWRMVPPPDYVAFGMVVSKGTQPLSLSSYMCIKRSLLSLAQASSIEKANEVLTTPHTFWTSASMISHFYLTPTSSPPDSNLVFSLRGENDERDSGSIEEISWMLDTFCHVTKNPSQPMDILSPYVFKSELVHGLMLSFENAPPENQQKILNFISIVIRRMRANNVNESVRRTLTDISSCMDTLYNQQKQNKIFSPSFQSLIEVMISASLMCYDSIKEGIENVTPIYRSISNQPYFLSISKVAIVMEALVHRNERPLPLEYVFDPYMLSILVRLRRSLVFQSEHPYINMIHSQMIECPDASSLTFRFDTECCSEEDDVFAVFPDRDTRNPILLLSGHNYSHIQTKASTNKVYIQFPFCQMSTLQFFDKSNVLAYNDTRTIVGYRSQNVWYSITTDKCVSSGIVSFTFCIRQLNRLNMFIGISGVSLCSTGFLGADNNSWALMASGTIWHNSRKQGFCNPLKTNDIVKLTVNFSEHTIAITINGEYQGIAFRDIPANRPLMPGVSFFDAGDMVELVNYKICATTYSQAPIDIDYTNNENSEESAQWLKRVPERRLKLARDMANMGFDIHVCVLALEASNDDPQVAADYLLANMKELSQKTAHLIDSQNRIASEKEKEEKSNWFMNAFLEDEKQRSMQRLPWTCPYCLTRNDFTQRTCMHCEQLKPDLESADMANKNKLRWGFRLHVLPDFAPNYLQKLTEDMIRKNELRLPASVNWTIEADHDLVELASEFCYIKTIDIMTLFPGHLVPNDRLLMKYGRLIDFTISQMQIRFYVIQQFNKMVRDSLPFINIACENNDSTLARNLRSLRGLIFHTIKTSWLEEALAKSNYSGKISVAVDRRIANSFREKKKQDTQAVYTEFGQLFQQVKKVDPSKLRHKEHPIVVDFLGEFGHDAGGLYREIMTDIGMELETEILPLFLLSPNGRSEMGTNRDVFIPNPKSNTPVCIEMYEFLGKLMGLSIRTQTPLMVNIADLFWKRLVGMDITIMDIISLDIEFSNRIKTILDSGKEEDAEMWTALCKQMQLTYTVRSSNGEVVELFPGGKDVYVPWSERMNYIEMMKDYRIKEFDAQIDAVYRGLSTQIPRHFLKLFTPNELKISVSGRPDINIALLKENTEYGEGYDENSTAVKFFWNVINNFSDEERVLYLRFVWARSRLPLDSKSFHMKHVINKMDKKNPNQYCPVAHTCFFTLDLPNYSNETVCRERLLYAIHNAEYGGDDTARALASAAR